MFRTLYTYIRMFYYMLKFRKGLGVDLQNDIDSTVFIADKCFKYAKYSLEVVGIENIPSDNGILFVANHQSFFDIFAAFSILRRQLSFIAKKELDKFFHVGEYITANKGVLIDRDDVKSQVQVIRDLTTKLKEGANVVIFPEGTRTKDGLLNEFKSGSFKMVLKSGCDIVPITYYDNHVVCKNKGDNIIKVKIDKAIAFEDVKDMKTVEIASYVKSIIEINLLEGFDRNAATKIETN